MANPGYKIVALRTNATSFIIYAKPDLFSGVGLPTLLSQQNGTGTGRSILYFDEVTKFLTTALGGTAVSGTKRLRSNTYYCFIVIIDINTPSMKIYIGDGANLTLDISAPILAESATGNFIIGANKSLAFNFKGNVCGYKVFNKALSSTEVNNLYYYNGFNSNDVLQEFNFTTGSGATLVDTGATSTKDFSVLLFIYPKPSFDSTWYNTQLYSQNNGTGTGRTWLGLPYAEAPTLFGKYSSSFGGGSQNSDKVAELGKWQAIGITYELSTHTLKYYYFDDIKSPGLIKTITSVTIESATGYHCIGASKNGGTNPLTGTRCFGDYVGPSFVWKRKLLDSEMLAGSKFQYVDRTRLELELLMQQNSGNIIDTSGNNHTVIVSNGATWSDGQFMASKTISSSKAIA